MTEVTEFLKRALQSTDHRIHEIAGTDGDDDSPLHTRGYAALLSDELKSFCNSDYVLSNYKEILRGTCLLFENVRICTIFMYVCMYVCMYLFILIVQ